MTRLVLRADGGSATGLGHISRALALVDMLGDGLPVSFYTRCAIDEVTRAIASVAAYEPLPDGVPLDDEVCRLAAELTGDETVILDGNQFDERYQHAIRERGCGVVCIDDIATRRFCADLIINHGPGVTVAQYDAEPDTRFCLGPRFAMLRASFLAAAAGRHRAPDENQVLVCLGGADPRNALPGVIDTASRKLPGVHFHVVVGAAYARASELDAFLNARALPSTLYRNLDAAAMAALMQRCGSAITSASTTALEYASIGGVLYVEEVAADQSFMRRGLIAEGIAFALEGPTPTLQARARAVEQQRQLLDGRSGERLRAAIRDLSVAHRTIR